MECKVREENVTVSLGFSLRFTTRIHFTFSSTAACPSLLPHVSPEGFADRESFTPRGDACGA